MQRFILLHGLSAMPARRKTTRLCDIFILSKILNEYLNDKLILKFLCGYLNKINQFKNWVIFDPTVRTFDLIFFDG